MKNKTFLKDGTSEFQDYTSIIDLLSLVLQNLFASIDTQTNF